MDQSATRKRKSSCSEESAELSTSPIQVKTRLLENPTCSDLVSAATSTPAISGNNKLASESVDPDERQEVRENEVTVEFTAEPTCDRGERSHVEVEQQQAVAEESTTMASFMTAERMHVAADEFKRSFLANVENMRKQFIDKYNFDIVKDEPLEGPYEWVRIDQNNKP